MYICTVYVYVTRHRFQGVHTQVCLMHIHHSHVNATCHTYEYVMSNPKNNVRDFFWTKVPSTKNITFFDNVIVKKNVYHLLET